VRILQSSLLQEGYVVHGLRRRTPLFIAQRIDHLYKNLHELDARFFLHQTEMTDTSSLMHVILKTEPNELYSLPARRHVAVSFEESEYAANSDAVGTLRGLKAVRILEMEKKIRFYQAPTSKLYGVVRETPQSEMTRSNLCSPYAVAKVYACWMTVNYREACGSLSSWLRVSSESTSFRKGRVPMSAASMRRGLYCGGSSAVVRRKWTLCWATRARRVRKWDGNPHHFRESRPPKW
jgi:GDP-mannose 4,6-dehydratase